MRRKQVPEEDKFRGKRQIAGQKNKIPVKVYLSKEEHAQLLLAANGDRTSLSGYMANAALDKAEKITKQ